MGPCSATIVVTDPASRSSRDRVAGFGPPHVTNASVRPSGDQAGSSATKQGATQSKTRRALAPSASPTHRSRVNSAPGGSAGSSAANASRVPSGLQSGCTCHPSFGSLTSGNSQSVAGAVGSDDPDACTALDRTLAEAPHVDDPRAGGCRGGGWRRVSGWCAGRSRPGGSRAVLRARGRRDRCRSHRRSYRSARAAPRNDEQGGAENDRRRTGRMQDSSSGRSV